MKKFAFSLERVLGYKDQVLEREKNTLMQLRVQKNLIDERIKELENEFEEENISFQIESRKGITVAQVRCHEMQMVSVREMIKQAEKESLTMGALVEKQLRIVVAASQEVSGLDKLEEKQREEYGKMVIKAEEAVIAEYVTTHLVGERIAQQN